jgi:hypothetical protein
VPYCAITVPATLNLARLTTLGNVLLGDPRCRSRGVAPPTAPAAASSSRPVNADAAPGRATVTPNPAAP